MSTAPDELTRRAAGLWSPIPTDPADRAAALRAELAEVGARFVNGVLELVPAVEELAHLEAELRAAEHQAGQAIPRPPLREMATEVVLGYLCALNPYLKPSITRQAAEFAAENLMAPPVFGRHADADDPDDEGDHDED